MSQGQEILHNYRELFHSTMSNGNQLGPESAQSSSEPLQSLTESTHSSTLGSFEASGLVSSTREPNSSSVPEQADSSSENGQLRILKELKDSVEIFRGGKSTKMEMITAILHILSETSNVSLTQSQNETTFDSYLKDSQSWERKMGG